MYQNGKVNLTEVGKFYEGGSRACVYKGNDVFNKYMSEDSHISNLMATANGRRKVQSDGVFADSFGLYDSGMHHSFVSSINSVIGDAISARDVVEANMEAISRFMMGLIASPQMMQQIQQMMNTGQAQINATDLNTVIDLFTYNRGFGYDGNPVSQCRFGDQFTSMMGAFYSMMNKLAMSGIVVQDSAPVYEAASQVHNENANPMLVGYAMAGALNVKIAEGAPSGNAMLPMPNTYGVDQFGTKIIANPANDMGVTTPTVQSNYVMPSAGNNMAAQPGGALIDTNALLASAVPNGGQNVAGNPAGHPFAPTANTMQQNENQPLYTPQDVTMQGVLPNNGVADNNVMNVTPNLMTQPQAQVQPTYNGYAGGGQGVVLASPNDSKNVFAKYTFG